MELNTFAEAILFGQTLSEKLITPTSFSDERPRYAGRVPKTPGRSARTRFAPPERRPTFPKVSSLDHADGRAATLHFFANHELMALELMALALLKFPEAPPEFRLGIARTMLEEQTHFQLYRERIEALGMEFGDQPLNSFFWDALSGLKTPLDYVCQLSLTFEQANLDFAEHYRDLFSARDDDASAQVMQKIYDDEVGHVAFGVQWFERLRAPGPSAWEAYVDALPHPLSPIRAKGIGFSEAGRRAAGLPEDFIRNLKVYSRSKGSPPRLFLFNVAAPESPAQRDLGVLSAYFATTNDIAVAPRPRLAWLEELRERGVPLPEFVAEGALLTALEPRRHLHGLHVHARDERAAALTTSLADKLGPWLERGGDTLDALEGPSLLSALAPDKAPPSPTDARDARAGEGLTFGTDQTARQSAAADVTGLGPRDFVRGQGRQASGTEGVLPYVEAPRAQVDAEIARNDRSLTFALHLDTSASGRRYSITRPLDLGRGVRAWALGHPWEGAPTDLVRYLHGPTSEDGRTPLNRIRALTKRVRERLLAAGYRGPASVDFSVSDLGGGLSWRWEGVRLGLSFDGVATAVARWTTNRGPAIWLCLGPEALEGYGGAPSALYAHLRDLLPANAVLATNDPEAATTYLSALCAGPIEGTLETLSALRR